jgi:two-component system sensor histidine kinase YesM
MKRKIKALSYLRKFGHNSIVLRNFVIFLSVIIVTIVCIHSILFYNIQKMFEEEVNSNNQESLLRVENTTDGILNDTQHMASYLCINDITQLLVTSERNDYIISSLTQKILDTIKSYSLVNQYLDSILVYSENNDFVITQSGIMTKNSIDDNRWLSSYENDKYSGAKVFFSPKKENSPDVISIVNPIVLNFDYAKKPMGAVVININVEKLKKYIYDEKNMKSQDVLILNSDNIIMLSNNLKFVGQKITDALNIKDSDIISGKRIFLDKRQYEIRSLDAQTSGFKYISLSDVAKYNSRLERSKEATILSALIFVLLGAGLAAYMSMSFFNPIEKIINIIESTETQDADMKSILKRMRGEEYKYIISSISTTISNRKELEMELKKRLLMLQKAQTGALQAQINPHFLYNTLNMLSWMAVGNNNGKKNKLSDAIINLAELFRLSLDMENYAIPLSKEIEHAKLYVEIAKLRYENEIKVVWQIPDDMLDNVIVKVCLQPIIENSISHGINPKNAPGLIEVKGWVDDGNIYIEIKDNGIGMDAKSVEEINDKFHDEYLMTDGCIGIRNINFRIKLIYGQNYGLKIESVKGQGTTVLIALPNTKEHDKIVD